MRARSAPSADDRIRLKTIALLVALVALAAPLAGCFGAQDDGGSADDGDDPTVIGPGDDTNETPTPPANDTDSPPGNETPPTNATPTPDNSTEEPPAEPPAPLNLTVTIAGAASVPVPEPTPSSANFTVEDAGWTAFDVACEGSEWNAGTVEITLEDSAGTVHGTATMSGSPLGGPEPAAFTVPATAPAGDFRLTATPQDLAEGYAITCNVAVAY